MRKKLLDDVSVNELLEFRREGYTNSEIAEMLDVSPQTIYSIIGKMPDSLGGRAKASEEFEPVDDDEDFLS